MFVSGHEFDRVFDQGFKVLQASAVLPSARAFASLISTSSRISLTGGMSLGDNGGLVGQSDQWSFKLRSGGWQQDHLASCPAALFSATAQAKVIPLPPHTRWTVLYNVTSIDHQGTSEAPLHTQYLVHVTHTHSQSHTQRASCRVYETFILAGDTTHTFFVFFATATPITFSRPPLFSRTRQQTHPAWHIHVFQVAWYSFVESE